MSMNRPGRATSRFRSAGALWLATVASLVGCPDPGAPPPAQIKIGPSGLAEKVPAYVLDSLGAVPEFALVDQTGAAVTHASLLGKPWLGDFMFTSCPDICPTLSARLAEVQHKWGERLQIASFSVDPGTDTPEKLTEYAARFNAISPHWRFFTGDVTTMKTVVVDGFRQVMEKSPATAERPETVLHGSRFILADKLGVIRAYPNPETPGEIEGYVEALLAAGG